MRHLTIPFIPAMKLRNMGLLLFAATLIVSMQNCSNLNSFEIGSSSLPVEASLPSTPELQTNSDAQVTIGGNAIGTIAPDFIGFSYEKSILYTPFFSASNNSLVSLFSKWGPGILRVGGNTVNKTNWNPSGTGLTVNQMAPADVDRLAGFLRATGWKVIYGLNDTTSSVALTTAEAQYAAQSLGDRLEDFEIGNEPNLYVSNGLEPSTFKLADFENNWSSYSASIKAVVPDATFSGPAVSGCCYSSWTIPFANVEKNQLEYLTHHYYRADGKLATSTMTLLLTPDANLPSEIATLVTAASSNNISKGFRMAETNSFYNGGALGVSNGFGAALWVIEYCMTLAQNGAVGANFHGGGQSTGYTPIANDSKGNVVEVRPDYYGMFFFSMMGSGKILPIQTSGTASSLFAYAIQTSQGVSVALINNSSTDVIHISVSLPTTLNSPTAMLLTAPSLNATSGTTFGGASIGADGTWSPTESFAVSVENGVWSVDLPAGSAYLVRSTF